MTENVRQAAGALLSYLATGLKNESFFGCMSTNIYDTAWVSMVLKPSQDVRVWLFPESFLYILENQCPDGGWTGSSELDRILNTLAALLSLLKHNQQSRIISHVGFSDRSQVRISRAVVWLDTHLRRLNVRQCPDNFTFGILLTSHLRYLQEYEVAFELPNLEDVIRLSTIELNKLPLENLYQGKKDTILRSLEALIGIANFERLASHLNKGSMMASPSSTAAYLINAPKWDNQAEGYLRSVFRYGQGNGNGAFPSAYPTEIFETTLAFTTLLEAGSQHILASKELYFLADVLENGLYSSGGTLGFSHSVLADADNTAKCLQCLSLIGRPIDVRPLLNSFESEHYFKTYKGEISCSLSANCNVLVTLLSSASPECYEDSIIKATVFICERWFSNLILDKWNTSREYSTYLTAQALSKLFHLSAARKLASIPKKLLETDVPLILTQILSRTLNTQDNKLGSWGSKPYEITAYAILTLARLMEIPQITRLVANEIQSAIHRGREFLGTDPTKWLPSPIWIEKVTYSSSVLTQAYCIAALLAPLQPAPKVSSLAPSEKQISKLGSRFQSLPLFKKIPNRDLILKCAALEGIKLRPYLEEKRDSIFKRSELHAEKYLTTVPFAWTACNTMLGFPLSSNVLIEMLIVSMLNFQLNEFLNESLGLGNERVRIGTLEIINSMFHYKNCSNDACSYKAETHGHSETAVEQLGIIESLLTQYVSAITSSRPAQCARKDLRWRMEEKLGDYLRAQIESTTTKDSHGHPQNNQATTHTSFIDWARATGADETSCPYSFAFYLCAITTDDSVLCTEALTSYQEYVLGDICGHLATLCRLYNDYGSLSRDREEGRLNSFDFLNMGGRSGEGNDASGKQTLLLLAQHEREAVHTGMGRLRLDKQLPRSFMPLLQLFVNVVDLFGQMSVVGDVGTGTLQRRAR